MKQKNIAFWGFLILMIALGASDSLRGVFSVIFTDHFSLTTHQAAQIVTVSYAGNLVFLLIGGRLTDRFPRKTAMLAMLLIWMLALLLFVASDNFYAVLIGMFFAMGASTLLSTTINIVTPLLFAATPGLAVNFLFFAQGVGTSGSQSVTGNLASDFYDWKLTNGLLLVLGVAAFLCIAMSRIPDHRSAGAIGANERSKYRFKDVLANRSFIPVVLLFGFYFIAEHGIMNWLVAYGMQHLSLAKGTAANALAIFFGGITAGRLIFSPLIDRLGIHRSITIFTVGGSLLYVTGVLGGVSTLWLLSASGLFFSILYPTMLMMLQHIFPASMISTATGAVISLASLFDIGFNVFFGKMVDLVGYGLSFLVLPASMLLFTIIYFGFVRERSKRSAH